MLDLGNFTVEELTAFREALDAYILSRRREEAAGEIERIDGEIAGTGTLLDTVKGELADKRAELAELQKRVGLGASSDPAPSEPPTPALNGHGGASVDSPMEIMDRKRLAKMLEVHPSTLSRWITHTAAPFLSVTCREGGTGAELTGQDEAVLRRVKELREDGKTSREIEATLNDEYPNHRA